MREKEIEGNKNVIHARDQEIKNLKETVNDLKKQLLSEDDGIEVLNWNKSHFIEFPYAENHVIVIQNL